MITGVSVKFSETVWRNVLGYEPSPPGVGLASGLRGSLTTAARITDDCKIPVPWRIATFTPEEAEQLEAWLAAVVSRPNAPTGAGAALAAVREGIRVAQ